MTTLDQGIRYDLDSNGILILTLDLPGQSANTMNDKYRQSMTATVAKIKQDEDKIKGIIFASAKKTFFAGGDLNELIQLNRESAPEFFEVIEAIKAQLRYIETMGIPVVAAINGAALGGGWEICLACHYRVAVNSPKVLLGLPETQLGLLPGGGGVTRMVRYLGLEKSLPYILEAKQFRPEQGVKAGLIDQLVDRPEELIDAARKIIADNPKAVKPWDEKGFRLPGGAPNSPKLAPMLAVAPAMLAEKTKGNYPAQEKAMEAAVEGAQVDFDTASRIESRKFIELATGQVSKNMIHTFFFQMNEVKAGASRPDGFEPNKVSKVGVLGAGMMGAGIAYVCANKGVEVVLKDVSMEQAEKGKAYSENLFKKKLSKGHMTEAQFRDKLGMITPTTDVNALEGCDLIIEAVFEDRDLKAKVTKESEPMLSDSGFFSSNTSTLPITGLAEASVNPAKYIGLHFFSPVDKMPLLEIITGKETSDETLAKAYDFALQIGKTPIVVNDSRGFYTSRTFGTFLNEGAAMLAEGIEPALIENGARLAGMPVGPLAIADEVSLTLPLHIAGQTREDLAKQGIEFPKDAMEQVAEKMVNELSRKGKAAGSGFYEYPEKGKKHLWSGLNEHFNKHTKISLEDVKERFLFIQSLETVRCLEENVLMSTRDANIGSIMGIGFPPWTGGAIQFINQYGVSEYVNRAEALSKQYGARFKPTEKLKEMAASGSIFKD